MGHSAISRQGMALDVVTPELLCSAVSKLVKTSSSLIQYLDLYFCSRPATLKLNNVFSSTGNDLSNVCKFISVILDGGGGGGWMGGGGGGPEFGIK